MFQKEYTGEQLESLIAELESNFTAELEKAEKMTLAKSEEEKKESPKEKEDTSKEEPAKDAPPKDEPKKDDSKQAENDEKHEAPADEHAAPEHKEDEKAPEHKEHAEHAEHDKDGHGYAPEEMDEMHKMYMSMSKAERMAHHDSCRMAMDKCGDMQMVKSEKTETISIPDVKALEEVAILKSEIVTEKSKSEQLQKTLDAVTQVVKKLVEKQAPPAGKAITELNIAASEDVQEARTLTKTEIDSVLMKKSADPKTVKADRDAINAFYLSNAGINTISHLLK